MLRRVAFFRSDARTAMPLIRTTTSFSILSPLLMNTHHVYSSAPSTVSSSFAALCKKQQSITKKSKASAPAAAAAAKMITGNHHHRQHAHQVFHFMPSSAKNKIKVTPWESSSTSASSALEIDTKMLSPDFDDENALFDLAGNFIVKLSEQQSSINSSSDGDLMAVLVVSSSNKKNILLPTDRDQTHIQASVFAKMLNQVGCKTFVVHQQNDSSSSKTSADEIFNTVVPTDDIIFIDIAPVTLADNQNESDSSSSSSSKQQSAFSSKIQQQNIKGANSSHHDEKANTTTTNSQLPGSATDSSSSTSASSTTSISIAFNVIRNTKRLHNQPLEFHGSVSEVAKKFLATAIFPDSSSSSSSSSNSNTKQNRVLFVSTPTSNTLLLENLMKTINRRLGTHREQMFCRSLPSSSFDSCSDLQSQFLKAPPSRSHTKDRIRIFEESLFRKNTSVNEDEISEFRLEVGQALVKNHQTHRKVKVQEDSIEEIINSDLIYSPEVVMKNVLSRESEQQSRQRSPGESETFPQVTIITATMKSQIEKELSTRLESIYKNPQRQKLNRELAEKSLKRHVSLIYTSTKHKYFKREANPVCEFNYVKQFSLLDYRGNLFSSSSSSEEEKEFTARGQARLPPLDDFDLLIIHGSKEAVLLFDHDPEIIRFLRKGGRIWCTAIAEYCLSGYLQPTTKYPENMSLNHLALRHHSQPVIAIASDELKASSSFENNKKKCELLTNIFHSQLKLSLHQVQLQSLLCRMDAALFHAEVERNGIFVHPPHLPLPVPTNSPLGQTSNSSSTITSQSPSLESIVSLNILAKKLDMVNSAVAVKTHLRELLVASPEITNPKTRTKVNTLDYTNHLSKVCDYRLFFMSIKIQEDRIVNVSCLDTLLKKSFESRVNPLRRVAEESNNIDDDKDDDNLQAEPKSSTKKNMNGKKTLAKTIMKSKLPPKMKKKGATEIISNDESTTTPQPIIPSFSTLSSELGKFLRFGSHYSDRVFIVFKSQEEARILCHHFQNFSSNVSIPFQKVTMIDGSIIFGESISNDINNAEDIFKKTIAPASNIQKYSVTIGKNARKLFAMKLMDHFCTSGTGILNWNAKKSELASVAIPLKTPEEQKEVSTNNKNNLKTKSNINTTATATAKSTITKTEEKILNRWISYGDPQNVPGSYISDATVDPSDNCIHQEVRLCNSATGRTTSRQPNCQTIPRLELPIDKAEVNIVRKSIVSRFGPKDGYILEFDFKQLEIAVQALLAQDPQMIQDMKNGVDFHLKRCTVLASGSSYEELRKLYLAGDQRIKDMRTKAKLISFQKMYGAGTYALSRSTGLPQDTVEQMIDAEAQLFPKVALLPYVDQEMCLRKDNPSADLERYRILELPTGARVALERNAVDRMLPIIKNYPVQSYAAELMSLVLGKIYREFIIIINSSTTMKAQKTKESRRRFHVINFVHDSIWIDCHQDDVEFVHDELKRLLSSVDEILEKKFPGAPCNVKFGVSASIGRNMAVMEDYEYFVPKKKK